MKHDYYLWFLIIFVFICSCIICYRYGYASGFEQAQSTFEVIIPQEMGH